MSTHQTLKLKSFNTFRHVTEMVAKITLTPEIDESLKRIQDAKNVDGILLINREGIPIKTSLDSSVTAQVKQMALTCRIIFRRLRTTS